jgi:hypothetical protein
MDQRNNGVSPLPLPLPLLLRLKWLLVPLLLLLVTMNGNGSLSVTAFPFTWLVGQCKSAANGANSSPLCYYANDAPYYTTDNSGVLIGGSPYQTAAPPVRFFLIINSCHDNRHCSHWTGWWLGGGTIESL